MLLLLAISLFASTSVAQAADLYRIRFEHDGQVTPGGTIEVHVLLDHCSWPLPSAEAVSVADHAIHGYLLDLLIPSGLTFQSASFEGTAVEEALGGEDPLQSLFVPTETGLLVSVTFGEDSLIHDGTGQPILVLEFLVESMPETPLGLSGSSADTPSLLLTVQGALRPSSRNLTWGEGESGFPEVTTADLEVVPFPSISDPQGLAEAGPSGGAAAASGGGSPLSSECQYMTELGDPAGLGTPDRTVTPTGQTIQDAIDDYPGTGDWVIRVEAGPTGSNTYVESLTIDLGLIDGTLTIYTDDGPDAVTLESAGGLQPAAITITGSGPGEGNVLIGWSNASDTSSTAPTTHTGWYGFRISQSGAALLQQQPAVLVDDVDYGSVQFRGNWFDDNPGAGLPAPNNGGALRVESSEHVEIVFNEFSNNSARVRGAGIYCTDSWVFLANNWVHDNRFLVTGDLGARAGGGIYLDTGTYTLCRNFVYANDAIQGGGVRVGYFDAVFADRPDETVLHVEANEIRENEAYTPTVGTSPTAPYQGGGLWIEGTRSGAPTTYSREFRIINNFVSANSSALDFSFSPAQPSESEMGGGLYLDLLYAEDSDGEFHPRIEGNRIEANIARLRGAGVDAGVFFETASPLLFPLVANNSIAGNELEPRVGVTPTGTGLYLHVDQRSGLSLTPIVPAKNCIVWDNFETPPGPAVEWFAECGFPTVTSDWESSVLRDYGLTGTCQVGQYNLFGANSLDVNPVLLGGPIFDSHLTSGSGAAIDLGDPSVSLFVPTDQDGDSFSVGAGIDRGADEFIHSAFVRGDATGDGVVDIGDPIAIQNSLFSPGVPYANCDRAGDANDDEFVNIADPVYLLGFLFSQGPPPPAPFPLCGFDPTLFPPPLSLPFESCLGCGP